jgi:hypothetical protein
MDTSTLESKLKWETPRDPTKFELHYPPAKAPRKTQQWDNWLRAMMMDRRLNSRDRVVLTALASHYNLKNGDCFPAVGRLAIEAGLGEGKTGTRAVERSLANAAELGWIKRTARRGGPREKNQTNLYELTLPQSICDVLASIGYEPPGPGGRGYKYPTSGDRPDKTTTPTRQNGGADPSLGPSITEKLEQGRIEHSVSKDTASAASRLPGRRAGAARPGDLGETLARLP